MPEGDGTVLMEGARMVFRNFEGKEGQYNRAGDRNFCILLDDDLARQMDADGWNIKMLAAREEGEAPTPYIQVSVGYGKGRPPRIVMISSNGRSELTEQEVEILDWVDIENVDLIIRPYNWEVSGNQGIKAYLKSLFITIREDYLEQKYAHVGARGGLEDD